ncbi:hypothetical protein FA13DRAFT_1730619 [Coprinellus micaceus]|uniref:NAD(P)-binding domain-containing protein n=1 Tax=Coprinellus micaceus TaxID=71717 RepID=A0A4Y7THB1_COPMI|nr:hypothetical protein FA13DRAFT_1730619 [Coprinellus micaceus]
MREETFERVFNSGSPHVNGKTQLQVISRRGFGKGGIDGRKVETPFVDLSLKRGVKRFVLLSSSRVHAYLEEIGVEFLVLRPTTFIGTIRSAILSVVAQVGKSHSYSVEDVAQVACRLYHQERRPFSGKEVYVVGPEALTHAEVCTNQPLVFVPSFLRRRMFL